MNSHYKDYNYKISWSVEDQEFIASCVEFPSLSYLHEDSSLALKGIIALAKEVVKDLEPLQQKGLYGKFIIRKADGSLIDPEAKYIVLRYDANSKDGNCSRAALLKYTSLIKSFNPQFADDLLKEIEIEQIKYREPLYQRLAES